MAKVESAGPVGPAQPSVVVGNISENRARLQQHMSLLQGFGHSELATLGKLTIGTPSGQVAVLQNRGVLLPSPAGPFGSESVPLTGFVRRSTTLGQFENLVGSAIVTASRDLPAPGKNQKTATIPVNTAYWFATEIVLQDDTTVVLAAGIASLVIVAEKLTIGKRVTLTWARPIGAAPVVPFKPETPAGWPQATSVGSERGREGAWGFAGGKGYDGAQAPEVELWFLQASGFPAIDLRGQDGGMGGKGGDGGDGGKGQKGCNTERKNGFCAQQQGGGGDGGNGGKAGDGGTGGNGGLGGKFSVYAPQPMINAWLQAGLTVSVDGGSAGPGGEAGRPGEGGPGGEKGDKLHPLCSNNNRTPGVKGNSGPSGNRGPDGIKGNLQPNSITYIPIDSSDFYIEAAKPYITSVYQLVDTKAVNIAFVGDTVTVTGARFSKTDKVLIRGYDGKITVPCATTFVADTLLTFVVPGIPGGIALLQVVQEDGTLSASKGTLIVRPKIQELYPAGRLVFGKEYFIRGTGLGLTGNVYINNEDIGAFVVVDNATVKFKVKRPSNIVREIAGEAATLKIVNAEGIGVGNPNHSTAINVVLDTYRMLVFGDSVAWGGGLPEHQKYYSLAADYYATKVGNAEVHRTVKAHHGAKIGRTDTTVKPEMPGEMSSRWPTISQQVEAMGSIPDAAFVDLVIIDGGANDLPITDVLMLSDAEKLDAEKAKLIANVHQYCYEDMVWMLQKVVAKFPNAMVIVPGYFHIVSEKSDIGFLQKFILSVVENVTTQNQFLSTPAVTRNKMIALSNTWVAESNKKLAAAVQFINDNLPGEPRVYFVNPETNPDNAAHAPNSFLWEPDALGGPTDPMWKGGREQQRDIHEVRLKSEGSSLLNGYFMTKRNSSYHPNVAGAQNYFLKMKPVLDKVAQAATVALRTAAGKYVTATGGGGAMLQGNATALGANETFDWIDLGNGKVALKSVKGQYVSAENNAVTVTKSRIGATETFEWVAQPGNKLVLKAANGKFLSVSTAAGNPLVATAASLSAAEKFVKL